MSLRSASAMATQNEYVNEAMDSDENRDVHGGPNVMSAHGGGAWEDPAATEEPNKTASLVPDAVERPNFEQTRTTFDKIRDGDDGGEFGEVRG